MGKRIIRRKKSCPDVTEVIVAPVPQDDQQEPLDDIAGYLKTLITQIASHTKLASLSAETTRDDARKIAIVKVPNYPSKFGAKIFGYYGNSDSPAVPLRMDEVVQYQSGDGAVSELLDTLVAESTAGRIRCTSCGMPVARRDIPYGCSVCPQCSGSRTPESIAYEVQQRTRPRVISGE